MTAILAALSLQAFLGALDNLWHHELKVRLHARPTARHELLLHALRSALYAPVFLTLGCLTWNGWTVWVFAALLLAEIGVTLRDFVEEDRSRVLPATERVLHTLLALNYGAFLALLIPELARWAARPAGVVLVDRGSWSWLMAIFAAAAAGWGVRDALAARRPARAPLATWQRRRFQVRRRVNARVWLVTGATGFIGSAVCRQLIERGDHLIVLARHPAKALDLFGPHAEVVDCLERIALSRPIDGVVNLAGEPIAARRWTPSRKAVLIESRVGTTRTLVAWLGRLQKAPRVLVSASAVGWYGSGADCSFAEQDPPGSGFAAALCAAWEREAHRAESLGMRVATLRIGLVLGCGGLLARLLPVYELGLGTVPGHGHQWLPWVHLTDVVGMIETALSDEAWHGPVNAVAPDCVRNLEFCAALARRVGRPLLFTLPAWALRFALGEMSTLLLDGQRVTPERSAVLGYAFRFPALDQALAHTMRERSMAGRMRGSNATVIEHA